MAVFPKEWITEARMDTLTIVVEDVPVDTEDIDQLMRRARCAHRELAETMDVLRAVAIDRARELDVEFTANLGPPEGVSVVDWMLERADEARRRQAIREQLERARREAEELALLDDDAKNAAEHQRFLEWKTDYDTYNYVYHTLDEDEFDWVIERITLSKSNGYETRMETREKDSAVLIYAYYDYILVLRPTFAQRYQIAIAI